MTRGRGRALREGEAYAESLQVAVHQPGAEAVEPHLEPPVEEPRPQQPDPEQQQ